MKDSQVSLSIITVVYNSEHLIEATIKSVLAQNFNDYEYIIIDGSSTDNTLNIINKFKDRINLIVSEADSGIYDAMNKGLKLATGDYVYFLNAGDIIYSDTALKIFSDHKSLKYDVIYGSIIHLESKLLIDAKQIDKIIYGMPFCHQAVFIRREVNNKFFFNLNFKIAADYNLFLNIYLLNYNFLITDVVFGEIDTSGISNTSYFKVIGEYLKIIYNSYSGLTKLVNIFRYLYGNKKFLAFIIIKKIVTEIKK
jgi:putative colanic acid biosynthesis glycosyltransferase